MSQLQQQLDLISHNVANVNTVGYKKRDATFSEMLYQQFTNQNMERNETNRLTPPGIRQGVGAKLGETKLVLTQGVIQETSRDLDVAFSKEGIFLQVLVEQNGQREVHYTRGGNLYVRSSGEDEAMLVNDSGHPVLDVNDNPIVFSNNPRDIIITPSGEFVIKPLDESLPTQIFELGLVKVNRPQLLEGRGGNLFTLSLNNAEGAVESLIGREREQAGLQQGALEQSNVDVSKEMTDMMVTQRAYQFNSRAISIADQMMGLVNGIR